MRPRPSLNKKVLFSVIAGILVIVAIVFALMSAFSGNGPVPPEPDPPPVSSQGSPNENDIQKPPQTFVEDEDKETDPTTEKDPATENETPTQQPDKNEETKPPVETPQEQPQEVPEKTSLSVQKIWDGMRASMGEVPTANMTLSKTNLQELYGIDPSICTEFILKKAGTAVTPEEYLIVKGSESNLTIIEQACQKRQLTLSEQWANIKDATDIISTFQVVRHGEYLFFGISPNISQLVGIFQGIMLAS